MLDNLPQITDSVPQRPREFTEYFKNLTTQYCSYFFEQNVHVDESVDQSGTKLTLELKYPKKFDDKKTQGIFLGLYKRVIKNLMENCPLGIKWQLVTSPRTFKIRSAYRILLTSA